jgi:hypothetical protein
MPARITPAEETASELTDVELDEVRKSAMEEVRKEQRTAALKAAREVALREERIKAGLEKVSSANIMVDFIPDLPENVAPNNCLIVDGRAFWHGIKYRIRLDQAQSLAAMQAAAWDNQAREDGKWRDNRRAKNVRLGPQAAA